MRCRWCSTSRSDRMAALTHRRCVARPRTRGGQEERRFRTDNDIDGMMDEALGALAVFGPSLSLAGGRLDERLEPDHQGRLRSLFPRLLRAEQLHHLAGGRFRSGLGARRDNARVYTPIPRGPPLPEVPVGEPPQKGPRRATVQFPAQAPALLVGYRAPAGDSHDSLVLDLLETALGHGQGSRLVRALIYQQELCVEARVGYGWRLDPGLFQISLRLNPGVETVKAEAALATELEKIWTERMPDEELRRAKNLVRANLLRSLVSTNGRAHMMGQMELMLGDWRKLLDLDDRYEAITADELQRVAKAVFAPHRKNVIELVPGEQLEADPEDVAQAVDAHLLSGGAA